MHGNFPKIKFRQKYYILEADSQNLRIYYTVGMLSQDLNKKIKRNQSNDIRKN